MTQRRNFIWGVRLLVTHEALIHEFQLQEPQLGLRLKQVFTAEARAPQTLLLISRRSLEPALLPIRRDDWLHRGRALVAAVGGWLQRCVIYLAVNRRQELRERTLIFLSSHFLKFVCGLRCQPGEIILLPV